MSLLKVITGAYFLSLVVMIFWTNVRPNYINYWNKTEHLKKHRNNMELDLDNTDIIMIANQAVVAVFGNKMK